ncbi:hypothetical protein BDV35DRAFT_339946 [Aspergillus flavus]|uniref:Secreted protein n=1 Tax=Aspergillus flavus TaxID=5059 RepID=A0A5N6H9Z6_ASPFL|nr:hypothetical protein BDV35DRAFT_339946 [Aspergillus flavus]
MQWGKQLKHFHMILLQLVVRMLHSRSMTGQPSETYHLAIGGVPKCYLRVAVARAPANQLLSESTISAQTRSRNGREIRP